MNKDLKGFIENRLKKRIIKISFLSYKTTYVKCDDSKEYVVKTVNSRINDLLSNIELLKIKSLLIPVDVFKYNKLTYAIFEYLYDYSIENKLKNSYLISDIYEVVERTSTVLTFDEKNYSRIMLLRRKLNNIFLKLDELQTHIESKQTKIKKDFDILESYYIFINCKKELYKIEKKLDSNFQVGKPITYSLVIPDLSLKHYVKNKIINYDKAYFGYYADNILQIILENIDNNIFIGSVINKIKKDELIVYYIMYMTYFSILSNIKITFNNDQVENIKTVSSFLNKTMNSFNKLEIKH